VSPRALLLAGGGLIVGATAVAFLLLVRGGGTVRVGAQPAPAEPAATAAPPPAETATAPAAVVVPVAGLAPADDPGISPQRRPRRTSASAEWSSVPVAARAYEMGTELARPVMAALDAAREQMEPCFEDERQRLAAGKGPHFDPADPPSGPALLVLRLQSREGAVDVADVEVESLGTSTRELATCCSHVLKGWPMPAPAALPGQRYRLKYVLQ
jgi:hypothetical protein